MKASVDYDFDEVISFCQKEAQESVHDLVDHLNALTRELEDCQDKFHCKGGNKANAVIKVYKGFADAIGSSNGCYSGKALGGLVAASAQIINVCYSEAKVDKETVESAERYNF